MQFPAMILLVMSLGLTACNGPAPNTVIHAATGDAALMPVTWGAQPPPSTAPAPTAPPVTQTQTVNVVVGPTSGLEPARHSSDKPEPTAPRSLIDAEAPTVTGAQEIELGNGEQIRYSGPATFFLLDAKMGLQGMFLVDVRELDRGYLADVWMLDGEQWRHGTMLRRLSLSNRTNMPLSPPPPRSMLDRFNEGVTWLVSDGAVVPGPSFYSALNTIFGDPSSFNAEVIPPNDAAHRNMLRFSLALAHFHYEKLRPCAHMNQYSSDLLAGFARMNRAVNAPWAPTRAKIPGNQ